MSISIIQYFCIIISIHNYYYYYYCILLSQPPRIMNLDGFNYERRDKAGLQAADAFLEQIGSRAQDVFFNGFWCRIMGLELSILGLGFWAWGFCRLRPSAGMQSEGNCTFASNLLEGCKLGRRVVLEWPQVLTQS